MGFWDKRQEAKRVATRAPAVLSDYRHNHQWCEKHWAPYVAPSASGLKPNVHYASYVIFQHFLAHPSVQEAKKDGNEGLNKLMIESVEPICCRLGDKLMDEILQESMKLGQTGEEGREGVPA